MWKWFKKILGQSSDPTISKSLKKNKTNVSRLKKYEWVNRVVVSLGALAIIAYFMPSPKQFNYKYEQGQAWYYPPLYSSYKFYVNMDDSTLMAKRDSISSKFEHYVKMDPLVVDSVKILAQEEVNKLIGWIGVVLGYYTRLPKSVTERETRNYLKPDKKVDDYTYVRNVSAHDIRLYSIFSSIKECSSYYSNDSLADISNKLYFLLDKIVHPYHRKNLDLEDVRFYVEVEYITKEKQNQIES